MMFFFFMNPCKIFCVFVFIRRKQIIESINNKKDNEKNEVYHDGSFRPFVARF